MLTSRRGFLAGLPAAAAMAALPVVSATDTETAALPETTVDRVERLMFELSDALSDYCRGQFRALVEPSCHSSAHVLLQGMHTDANLQRVADDVPATAAPGHAVMTIGNRRVTVDTAALPQQLAMVEEDSRTEALPAGVVEFVSMPERRAEYVALTHDGRIVIAELEQSLGSPRKREPRVGFMRGNWNGYRASHEVTVLGKVIA